MTKHELRQVGSLRAEIAELEEIRDRLSDDLLEVLPPEYVKGSMPEHPYTLHTVVIDGRTVDRSDILTRDRLQQYIKRIDVTRYRLAETLHRVEAWIEDIPDSEMRRIIRLRYIEGRSWQQIANALDNRYSAEAIQMKVHRFLK